MSNEKIKEYLKSINFNEMNYMDSGMEDHITEIAVGFANQQTQELQGKLNDTNWKYSSLEKDYSHLQSRNIELVNTLKSSEENYVSKTQELQRQLEWKETIKQEHIKNEARIVELLELGNLAADKISELQMQVERLSSKNADLVIQLAHHKDEYTQLKEAADENKQNLIEVCEYFGSAVDKDMTEKEMEKYLVTIANLLNKAITNYKHLTNKP